MRTIKAKASKRIVNILLAVVLLMGTVTVPTMTAQAAGVETLPCKAYDIGGFSFRNYNLTPVKTVTGRYVQFLLQFTRSASLDQGIASTPIKLTFEVRDANTGTKIGTYTSVVDPGHSMLVIAPAQGKPFDLGYAGRKIQLYFDASSSGPSNGGYRALTIEVFKSDSWN